MVLLMKKLLGIVVLSLLFTVKANSSSLPSDAIILNCESDDSSITFETLLIPSTKEGLYMGAYGSSVEELKWNDSYYQIDGLFNEGISRYSFKVNRSTGKFSALWYGADGSMDGSITITGYCAKKEENKF